jgi:uncharacterized protein (DUF1015 family)
VLDVRPFRGHVVAAERAQRVVAPPYDALAPATRAALAATDPDSYLGALPPGTTVSGGALDAVLGGCRRHLDRLLASGRYREVPGPSMGVLTLGSGATRAVAVVGDVPVAAFAALTEPGTVAPFTDGDGFVRPHEHVQPARVLQLQRYLEVVGVASSPVALTQRPDPQVVAATEQVTSAGPPDLAYRADDGVDVALWCVTDPARCTALAAAVAGAGPAYLADGHHRGAAAVRHASAVGAGPDDPAGRVLCAVLPSDHLAVHAFHRRLDGLEPDVPDLLDRLRAVGVTVTPLPTPRSPTAPHHVSLTAGGDWWDLDVTRLVRPGDLVEALDVRLVDRDLVPLLSGRDTPGAGHLVPTPVPAPQGLGALVAPGAVGLALYPPDVEAMLAVAAAGRSLPPKTTYVTPKLRSGLLVTPRGGPLSATTA